MADELLGYTRTGGIGTATSFLALALARIGHRVEALYTGDAPSGPMSPEWAGLYDDAGVAIRLLPRSDRVVEPAYFARMLDVEDALGAEPPDVVVVQDLAAPAYTAMRMRQLGLRFASTSFVVYCHGTRRWITDAARKVRVLPGAIGVSLLEQASIELADVVVSPSRYLIDWMRQQRWQLPVESVVIPHLTRSVAIDGPQPRAAQSDDPVRRLAFFGRLEDRKGIAVFIEGLNRLPAGLLDDLELDFIGRATPAWPVARIEAALSDGVRQSVARVAFATDLDQSQALETLARPGTLAVMPSFEETFGNTVRECLDYRIPFIASNAAAIRELVAPQDRERVLFTPTPQGVENALRHVLAAGTAPPPAEPAHDSADSLSAWAGLLTAIAPERPRVAAATRPPIDVIVVHRGSGENLERCLEALERQTYSNLRVIVAASDPIAGPLRAVNGQAPLDVVAERASVESIRERGLAASAAPFVVFLDDEDDPDDELLATLLTAQLASDADVVSCGLRLTGARPRSLLFHGDPGGLGLLANGYGTVALLRRGIVDTASDRRPVESDPDWPLLARLNIGGASIVSVPVPLVTSPTAPGTVHQHPSDALLVVDEFEQALPSSARALARLTAGLAAGAAARSAPPARPRRVSPKRLVRRRR